MLSLNDLEGGLRGPFTLTLRRYGPAIPLNVTEMPKAESSNPKAREKDTLSFEGPRHRPHWLAAFVCFVVGVLVLVALIDYEPAQSVMTQVAGKSEVVNGVQQLVPTNTGVKPNLVGVIGAEFCWWAYQSSTS